MTPEDKRLPQDALRASSPLKLYRLARAKYANLSGAGAALYPGRWNQLGQEAIYTSVDPSTPVLEFLAHTPKSLIPSNLAMMEILLDMRNASYEPTEEQEARASSLAWFCTFPTLKFAKEHYPGILWTKYSNLMGIAVPSVIVPAWNVVLYPEAEKFFEKVSLVSVEPFVIDPRLFPENTRTEST